MPIKKQFFYIVMLVFSCLALFVPMHGQVKAPYDFKLHKKQIASAFSEFELQWKLKDTSCHATIQLIKPYLLPSQEKELKTHWHNEDYHLQESTIMIQHNHLIKLDKLSLIKLQEEFSNQKKWTLQVPIWLMGISTVALTSGVILVRNGKPWDAKFSTGAILSYAGIAGLNAGVVTLVIGLRNRDKFAAKERQIRVYLGLSKT